MNLLSAPSLERRLHRIPEQALRLRAPGLGMHPVHEVQALRDLDRHRPQIRQGNPFHPILPPGPGDLVALDLPYGDGLSGGLPGRN